ncbi:hypothetical protein CERSUDRAFT_47214 [Gelatoporia subvermispora B]|uniref:AB hydrolase-1 domain-containing protein n=1 Tax=Ceriporiopsis subvermispora (strain B) TaxID=914234 RepID=M2QQ92_CERS8|nr:hypothetical protein CERSUDRAFT_47214 [Gelatoporia subvermispora B]
MLKNSFSTVNGIQLSYFDSGIPEGSAQYVTIFAIHGICFARPVFKGIMALAPTANIRLVAINRRGYLGSTPYTFDELEAFQRDDTAKEAFVRSRGLEMALFVDQFIQEHQLPPISVDGKAGWVAVLGWSMGSSFALCAVAHSDALPPESSARLQSHLRTLILLDPPAVPLGMSHKIAPWSPQLDTTISKKEGVAFSTFLLTAYFKHGDLSSRKEEELSRFVPSKYRPASIYDMSDADLESMLQAELADISSPDMQYFLTCGPQLPASYRKACYDPQVRSSFPRLKVWEICGEATLSHCWVAYWAIEDDNTTHGGDMVHFKVIDRANHFMHWDDPENTVQVLIGVIA